ncbi:hypothetical protein ACE5JW_11820 [Acinetobacter radioresistens]|jgi:hypothetical protein|uniref:hypothetical protein n=1 Tax=Acinetobacter radioresistens TaxID=40216 RepID=UPI0002D0CE9F|nr:hypothetical protein [Acinetobacter radioresistens]ENV88215.1 hypothetical protein F940_00061 [Acinetobacter radioresistens NIPH 2130]MCK4078625.1 hypothetical protein [Acinetobacter radioresistens]MCK4084915.1 hypothetical protein [Acinetobacter radioresistens]MCK4097307.1 hypothetical protein [Acinetobacter radioresistens]MCK4106364.1 hypothetical protein [Acinetobacter radioresistens]
MNLPQYFDLLLILVLFIYLGYSKLVFKKVKKNLGIALRQTSMAFLFGQCRTKIITHISFLLIVVLFIGWRTADFLLSLDIAPYVSWLTAILSSLYCLYCLFWYQVTVSMVEVAEERYGALGGSH